METETPVSASASVSMDGFLKSLGGCGTFQILFSTFVILPQLACGFSAIFMAFGSYNPGWRCLDDINDTNNGIDNYTINNALYHQYPHGNDTTTHSIFVDGFNNNNTNLHTDVIEHTNTLNSNASSSSSSTSMTTNNYNVLLSPFENTRNSNSSGNDDKNKTFYFYTDDDYTESMCKAFKSCRTIQFDPATSTIATEWGLLCDRSWILSLITSLQMAGTLIGAVVVGYLGDAYGRKWTLYSSVAINAVLQIVSMLSNSWQMFAGIRLFIGISNGVISFLPHAYISEFVVQKWRAVIGGLPVWILGTAVFSVAGMTLKDWRLLHAFNAGLSALCFLPVFWVPESVRWLMVKQKTDKSIGIVKKITRINDIKRRLPELVEDLNQISTKLKSELERINKISKCAMAMQLFAKDKLVISLVVGFLWFTNDLVYFVSSFVIPDLPGDFYTNLILISVTDLPGNVIASVIPNVFGRKRSLVTMFVLLSLSLILVIIPAEIGISRENEEINNSSSSTSATTVSILVLTIMARTFQNVSYCVLVIYVNELYPTVIRSTANGYGGIAGSIGSVSAPYLLPTITGSFYVSYLILGAASLACAILILFLPETKGEQMEDTLTRI